MNKRNAEQAELQLVEPEAKKQKVCSEPLWYSIMHKEYLLAIWKYLPPKDALSTALVNKGTAKLFKEHFVFVWKYLHILVCKSSDIKNIASVFSNPNFNRPYTFEFRDALKFILQNVKWDVCKDPKFVIGYLLFDNKVKIPDCLCHYVSFTKHCVNCRYFVLNGCFTDPITTELEIKALNFPNISFVCYIFAKLLLFAGYAFRKPEYMKLKHQYSRRWFGTYAIGFFLRTSNQIDPELKNFVAYVKETCDDKPIIVARSIAERRFVEHWKKNRNNPNIPAIVSLLHFENPYAFIE